MSSDNPSGADNQQETTSRTPIHPWWLVGFIDGEGCFSVSVHRNPHVRRTRGWQIQPAFQTYQHQAHRSVLEDIQSFFGCGRIRPKGPKSSVLTYSVWALSELSSKIAPFFRRYPLVVKAGDFEHFAFTVEAMLRKEHLTGAGFERVVRRAFAMNANGKQRSRTLDEVLMGSSETVRQASPAAAGVKIQSDPYGDVGSQAEMTWPLSNPE